ncbi:MAG TPA: hypothetical protein VGE45_22525 [Chloroflexia bacterium]|jgi:hypothetical protein
MADSAEDLASGPITDQHIRITGTVRVRKSTVVRLGVWLGEIVRDVVRDNLPTVRHNIWNNNAMVASKDRLTVAEIDKRAEEAADALIAAISKFREKYPHDEDEGRHMFYDGGHIFQPLDDSARAHLIARNVEAIASHFRIVPS